MRRGGVFSLTMQGVGKCDQIPTREALSAHSPPAHNQQEQRQPHPFVRQRNEMLFPRCILLFVPSAAGKRHARKLNSLGAKLKLKPNRCLERQSRHCMLIDKGLSAMYFSRCVLIRL